MKKQTLHKEGIVDVEQLPRRCQWFLEHAHKLHWCNNCAESSYNVSHTTRIVHIKQLYTINNLHMYILYNQGPKARIKMKKNPFKQKFKEL
jgi:hypothetical protein